MLGLTWNWRRYMVRAVGLLHAGLDLVQVDESHVCRASEIACFPGGATRRRCDHAVRRKVIRDLVTMPVGSAALQRGIWRKLWRGERIHTWLSGGASFSEIKATPARSSCLSQMPLGKGRSRDSLGTCGLGTVGMGYPCAAQVTMVLTKML